MKRNKFSNQIEVDWDHPLKELAEIGQGQRSMTIYPQLIEDDQLDLLVVDLPGFKDNRSNVINISNQTNVIHSFQSSKDMKIILVVKDSELLEGRGKSLKFILDVLKSMFRSSSKFMDSLGSIMMLVTLSYRSLEQIKDNIK